MSIFNYITSWAQQNFMGNTDSFKVSEIASSATKSWECLASENLFNFYKDKNVYKGVLTSTSQKSYLVFKISMAEDASKAFNALSYKLQVITSSCNNLNIEQVQKISDAIREHPSYGCAHIASVLGYSKIFAKENIVISINDEDELTGKYPLHVAIENEKLECIQELMFLNVRHDCVDHDGRTIFHYAAQCSDSNIIKTLASKDSSLINRLNNQYMTALHEACLNNQHENVDMLIRWKADPTISGSDRTPMHCAVASGNIRCVKALNRWNCELVHSPEKLFNNSVLHIAENKEMIHYLVELGCFLEAKNSSGQTPLLFKVSKGDLASAVGLLVVGADASARDAQGNGALHLAIKQDREDLVKLLIVFGADINLCNKLGVSPRHEVACSTGKNRDEMLKCLHLAGAVRCCETKSNCNSSCKHDGFFNGMSGKETASKDMTNSALDDFSGLSAFTAAVSRSESLNGFEDSERHRQKPGSRVLCLDGGGIRGLVTIKILMVLEHITGKPIAQSFDWIGGTSTGGILTMGLLQGKSLSYIMGAYFRLKDEVFQGKRPYNSEPLENFLKKELGEWTRMTDIQKPKVMLTTVLADRIPAELFVFKNYLTPGVEHDTLPSPFKKFKPIPRPQDQLVWLAVRATGAAPTYFRASGRFVDGGLISNNPTLDVLTEIHKFNTASKVFGNLTEVEPLHVVVSLGTGKLPQRFVEDCDVFRPEGIFDCTKAIWGTKNLFELVIDQATQSEGQTVSRSAAWCNMIDVPYFRVSPQLSQDIPLDCTDDAMLINMLWETQCYLQKNHEKLIQLANLLT